MTVDLFDFGTTDTSGIIAPPADQIGDLGSLLGAVTAAAPPPAEPERPTAGCGRRWRVAGWRR